MKLIDELDLVHLPDICRYLSGEMTVRECRIFEKRLREEPGLKADYDLLKNEVLNAYRDEDPEPKGRIEYSPKTRLGEVLKSKGLWMALMALVMGGAAIGITFLMQAIQ